MPGIAPGTGDPKAVLARRMSTWLGTAQRWIAEYGICVKHKVGAGTTGLSAPLRIQGNFRGFLEVAES